VYVHLCGVVLVVYGPGYDQLILVHGILEQSWTNQQGFAECLHSVRDRNAYGSHRGGCRSSIVSGGKGMSPGVRCKRASRVMGDIAGASWSTSTWPNIHPHSWGPKTPVGYACMGRLWSRQWLVVPRDEQRQRYSAKQSNPRRLGNGKHEQQTLGSTSTSRKNKTMVSFQACKMYDGWGECERKRVYQRGD